MLLVRRKKLKFKSSASGVSRLVLQLAYSDNSSWLDVGNVVQSSAGLGLSSWLVSGGDGGSMIEISSSIFAVVPTRCNSGGSSQTAFLPSTVESGTASNGGSPTSVSEVISIDVPTISEVVTDSPTASSTCSVVSPDNNNNNKTGYIHVFVT